MLANVLLTNSSPLSVRNVTDDPSTYIHLLKMYLMIASECLFGMKIDGECLVQWSTICKRVSPL